MKTFLSLCLFAIIPFCGIVGCGAGEGTTLIQPAQSSYQPTAEEIQAQKDMEATRQ